MPSFKKTYKNKFSGLFTALFIVAWFLCSAHINFSSDVKQVSSVPDSHQQSPTSHTEGSTSVCVDHSPTQNVSRYSNDISNTPVLVSNSISGVMDSMQKVGSLHADLIQKDHLNMRYSFLVHNKFLI